MATQAYSKTPASNVGELQLVAATPTLKFYKHPSENTVVVAIRGTEPSDAQDVKADASIAIGQLQSSQRFQQDLAALQRFQALNPPSQFDYYGVGHSLGGAILDLFLKMGLLKQGVSYNPAIQPTDFQGVLPNKRIYDAGDPLYKLMGQHTAQKPEVRQTRKKSWWERAVEKVPYVGKAYDLYRSHQLSNFVGGQMRGAGYHGVTAEPPLRGMGFFSDVLREEAERIAYEWAVRHRHAEFTEAEKQQLDAVLDRAKKRLQKVGSTYISAEGVELGDVERERMAKKDRIIDEALAELERVLASFDVRTREVSSGAETVVGHTNIPHGTRMMDFGEEAARGRYYTEEEARRLERNPVTREPIEAPTIYKADVRSRVRDVFPAPAGGIPLPPKKPLSGEGYGTTAYLKEARRRAKAHGYDPSKLELADDGVHKLQITTPEGKVVKFGRKGYGDHLIWLEKEAKGEVPRGTAEKKRSTFRKSHLAMKGQWREDKYSPNWLALNVLWS